jgi:hypothetical protein
MRTVRRQYAARNWTFTRVLPGIAGYCRVVGPGEIRRLRRAQSSRAECEVRNEAGRTASVRISPPGTAWDRINFFLHAKLGKKIGFADCVVVCRGHHLWGWAALGRFRISDTGSEVPGRRPALQSRLDSVQVVDFPHLCGAEKASPGGNVIAKRREKWFITR